MVYLHKKKSYRELYLQTGVWSKTQQSFCSSKLLTLYVQVCSNLVFFSLRGKSKANARNIKFWTMHAVTFTNIKSKIWQTCFALIERMLSFLFSSNPPCNCCFEHNHVPNELPDAQDPWLARIQIAGGCWQWYNAERSGLSIFCC